MVVATGRGGCSGAGTAGAAGGTGEEAAKEAEALAWDASTRSRAAASRRSFLARASRWALAEGRETVSAAASIASASRMRSWDADAAGGASSKVSIITMVGSGPVGWDEARRSRGGVDS